MDASFVINVYNKLRRCPKKIRNPHGDLRGQLVTLLDKQVSLTKVKSHITHEEHVSLGRESWSWHANQCADELASINAAAVAPFEVEGLNNWILARVKKLTMWMIPRIKYWLAAEAVVPKRVPDGPHVLSMSCLIKLKLKVLVVMFGDGALRVCVATLAVVSLKPIGLCLTWKSWLPCPVRVLVLKWGVVTLCFTKFILLIPCMVHNQPLSAPNVVGD